jgi:hypothetical protein
MVYKVLQKLKCTIFFIFKELQRRLFLRHRQRQSYVQNFSTLGAMTVENYEMKLWLPVLGQLDVP